MNLFDQVRRKASPLKHYEREFMCSVEGELLPEDAFDVDLGQRDFMCRECRAREVEDDRQAEAEAQKRKQAQDVQGTEAGREDTT